ncbi:uncharacterized protein LOC122136088 isoform X1 [Cyprinus carpio]|uniref:Uncharacterized protein LOC122136088 isoform X1 n=1 Tax=Cyprinus carpio TaxID=7962 RepID=A0A9Q9VYJ2_CYPCA|nr:uncharacterized protein LOC122136088 isoform X1 [Cyprinus carpio]
MGLRSRIGWSPPRSSGCKTCFPACSGGWLYRSFLEQTENFLSQNGKVLKQEVLSAWWAVNLRGLQGRLQSEPNAEEDGQQSPRQGGMRTYPWVSAPSMCANMACVAEWVHADQVQPTTSPRARASLGRTGFFSSMRPGGGSTGGTTSPAYFSQARQVRSKRDPSSSPALSKVMKFATAWGGWKLSSAKLYSSLDGGRGGPTSGSLAAVGLIPAVARATSLLALRARTGSSAQWVHVSSVSATSAWARSRQVTQNW